MRIFNTQIQSNRGTQGIFVAGVPLCNSNPRSLCVELFF